MPDPADVERIFREEFGRSLASLIRAFGDVDLAEDAVQDAFATALVRWPVDGLPPNPGGWITTTARNRAIDRLRRESRGRDLLDQVAIRSSQQDPEPAAELTALQDERLRLIFMCCHPALSREAQVALTLRLLGGLSTAQIASAFLVAEPTMGQRLSRAKRKIRLARIPYRVPDDAELPARLAPVLAVVYLIYTAGTRAAGDSELCAEGIRLARVLVALMPEEPEALGLLALLLFAESRRPSRIAPDGTLVLLADQDRSTWDQALIAEGREIMDRYGSQNRPGAYRLQAAIGLVHAEATTAEQTDWPRILAIYDQLLALAPTPVVALNRAVAVAEVEGPASALATVDRLDLDGYYPFHATRADLLRRLGHTDEAGMAYRRAADLAPTEAERAYLRGSAA